MKVHVQIVDTKSSISQYGMIEEPIQKGFEIANALEHFGVNINSVEWRTNYTEVNARIMNGIIDQTTKIVNVIAI